MSMLSEQCKRLRELSIKVDTTMPEAAREMRHAADTIDELRERLALKTCRRVYHPNRTMASGPQYTCSVCGYGASDDRWLHCPKCGCEYGNSRADARDEAGYE